MSSEANGNRRDDELPLEEIREAAMLHPDCWVRVSRMMGTRGRPLIVGKERRATQELADLSDWLVERFGGGNYKVEAFLPDDLTQPLVRPFTFSVEGPSLAARKASQQQQQHATYGQPPTWAFPDGTPYVPLGIATQSTAHLEPHNRTDRPLTRYTPDEIAMRQASQLHVELQRERELRERERQDWEKRLDAIEKKYQDDRERWRDEQRRAQELAFEKRIELLTSSRNNNGVADYAPLLAAIAPVLSTMLATNKDREAIIADKQSKSMELQVGSMNKILEVGLASKRDDSTEKLMSFLMPIMTESIKSKPAMLEAMSDNQLTNLAMVRDLLDKITERDEESPWVALIKQALSGAMGVTEAYLTEKQRGVSPGVVIPPPRFAGAPVHVMQAGAPPGAPVGGVGAGFQQAVPQPQPPTPLNQPPSPEDLVNLIMMSPQVPNDFKTQEWKTILLMIHEQHDVAQTADTLLDHLEHLDKFRILPALLHGYPKNPREVFSRLLMSLPIARVSPEYVEGLLNALEHAFESVDVAETDSSSTVSPGDIQPNVS